MQIMLVYRMGIKFIVWLDYLDLHLVRSKLIKDNQDGCSTRFDRGNHYDYT